jgi:transcriptional regulator with XRE-family HTH domain
MLDMKEIGKRIRAVRKKAGLTQTQFGERVSISLNTVAMWERGELRISLENLNKIRETFNIKNWNDLLP